MNSCPNGPMEQSRYNLPFFTIGAMAKFLGVHPLTVLALVEKGAVPTPKEVGGHLRFDTKEIIKWLQERND